MKYHSLFFRKLGKMLQNLSSAAVMIGALRIQTHHFMIGNISPKTHLLNPLYTNGFLQ